MTKIMSKSSVSAVSVYAIRNLPASFDHHANSRSARGSDSWFVYNDSDQDLESVWIRYRDFWVVIRAIAGSPKEDYMFFCEHAICICSFTLETPIPRKEWIDDWRSFRFSKGNCDAEDVLTHALELCPSAGVKLQLRRELDWAEFFSKQPEYIVVPTKRQVDFANVVKMANMHDRLAVIERNPYPWSRIIEDKVGIVYAAFPSVMHDESGLALPLVGYIAGCQRSANAVGVISMAVHEEFTEIGIEAQLLRKFARYYKLHEVIDISIHESAVGMQVLLRSLHCKGVQEKERRNSTNGTSWINFSLRPLVENYLQ